MEGSTTKACVSVYECARARARARVCVCLCETITKRSHSMQRGRLTAGKIIFLLLCLFAIDQETWSLFVHRAFTKQNMRENLLNGVSGL